MDRDFKGVWIPKEIWLSRELSLQEKVFLVEISSLDNNEGCFASNQYFAEFFGLSKNRCSEVIKGLEKKGFITISYVRGEDKKNIDKRVIRVFEKSNRGIRDSDRPVRDVEGGYSEKCEENNTIINNTINNTKREKRQKEPKEPYDDLGLITLSKKEYDNLCEKNSKDYIDKLIANMSLYLAQNNKKPYKNCNLALQKWILNDNKNKAAKNHMNQAKPEWGNIFV